jgi:hypothetical protein
MLPNLKFLGCGILFCFLLFILAGAGVMLPDARTRIGEMPEIGRPMMQRSMAEAPAAIYMMAARSSDEPERLREPVPVEMAASPPPESDDGKPDLPKLDLAKPNRPQEDLVKFDVPKPELPATVPAPVSEETSDDGRMAGAAPAGSAGAEAPARVPIAFAAPAPVVESRTGPAEHAEQPQAAVLAVPAADDSESARFANVPLPPPRPAFAQGLRRHVRVFHRRHRIVQQQDADAQGVAPASTKPSQP